MELVSILINNSVTRESNQRQGLPVEGSLHVYILENLWTINSQYLGGMLLAVKTSLTELAAANQ